MVKKNAISYMLASKKAAGPIMETRNGVRASGVVVRSTKVMITERRDVPIVNAVKMTGRRQSPIVQTVKNQVKIAKPRTASVSCAPEMI